MNDFVNAHLWKLNYVYAHIRKCTYTKVDHFHICIFMEVGLCICSDAEARIYGNQLL
jgi:hypothetical protein